VFLKISTTNERNNFAVLRNNDVEDRDKDSDVVWTTY
jgi:hypothetical protein